MATTKLNLGNLPLRKNDNSGSENTQDNTQNQSIVLPGNFNSSNRIGGTTNATTVLPGGTTKTTANKDETTNTDLETPLQTWPGLAATISSAVADNQANYGSTGSNIVSTPAETHPRLSELLKQREEPEYEGFIESYTEEPKIGSRFQTNTGNEFLDNLNRTRNYNTSTNDIYNEALNSVSKTAADTMRSSQTLEDYQRLVNLGADPVDAYNAATHDIQTDEQKAGQADQVQMLGEALGPLVYQAPGAFYNTVNPLEERSTAEKVAEKSSSANEAKSAAQLENDLAYDAALEDADSLAYMSQHGYAVDTAAALDEFCNDRGLSYVEDDPESYCLDFQMYASKDEWRDWVATYPGQYWSYDEFSYDDEGNPISFQELLYTDANGNQPLLDACFEKFWNHYKPITVDQYFDFEDQAGNYTYNGTTTMDVYALCGSDGTVLEQWANALEANDWWNSEDLAEMVTKYSNDEPYNFAIDSNGSDQLENLEQTNAQAWLTTLFANAEKESTLKAQEANEYRNNPDSPWTEQTNGTYGINFSPSYIEGTGGLNNITYWLNPDMLYLGDETDNTGPSFEDLGLSYPEYTDSNGNTANTFPAFANYTEGEVTNDFSPVEWTGPEGATYNNYTMRNENKAFEGLPYWTSEAFATANPTSGKSIYSFTPYETYAENPTQDNGYYNPYIYNDYANAGSYSQSREEE